jgi:hypothetical protein
MIRVFPDNRTGPNDYPLRWLVAALRTIQPVLKWREVCPAWNQAGERSYPLRPIPLAVPASFLRSSLAHPIAMRLSCSTRSVEKILHWDTIASWLALGYRGRSGEIRRSSKFRDVVAILRLRCWVRLSISIKRSRPI